MNSVTARASMPFSRGGHSWCVLQLVQDTHVISVNEVSHVNSVNEVSRVNSVNEVCKQCE